MEATVLLSRHGRGNVRDNRSIMPTVRASSMKAKDVKRPIDTGRGGSQRNVRLSILRVNKPGTRQRITDDAPPTESPPTPPADLDAALDPAPAPESLPSFTPRSVDDVDFDEEAFQSALEDSAGMGAKGEEVCGTVIGHESDGVYVDIGGKAPGWLPRQECGLGVVTDVVEQFPQGKQLKVLVTGEQNAEGMVTVSCQALMVRESWATMTRLAREAAVVQTLISGFNRGGCTCHVEGLRGFIPRSQLVDGDNHSTLVGKTVGVTVLEVNPKTSKLVLSEKQASRTQRFAELKVGDLVTGRISGLRRFGCFVDLGPVSGLLHQRCISASHVGELREVFTVGETISALVTDVDAARGRIALNTALLESLPGEMLMAKADVMGQAEQRAERARTVLFQERQQDQQPAAPDPVSETHGPVANSGRSPAFSPPAPNPH
ncbi:MAG: S1 RNA-binding domain-containing protein, partial [Synechococcus sp. SB0677_bin_5]|nr:S1 RNA-binding domain-containing protein [Synechococcus sp. SB0677_bin_5]